MTRQRAPAFTAATLLLLLVLFSPAPGASAAVARGGALLPVRQALGSEPRYADIRRQDLAAGRRPAPGALVVRDAPDFAARAGEGRVQTVDGFEGEPGPSLLWQDDVPWIEWQLDVARPGIYQVELRYFPLAGKRASIQRGLQLDGRTPFAEARRLVLHRVWREATLPGRDNGDNDLRPPQVEVPRWQTVALGDGDGWYSAPFGFYLETGPHRLRLTTLREPLAIRSIRLTSAAEPPAYVDFRAEQRRLDRLPVGSEISLKLQGEYPSAKSDPTIRAEASFDPRTEPPASGHFRLNAFGGWRWRQGGRWAEWTVEAPVDGLYALGFRALQNADAGMPIPRKVEIDGSVPFAEFAELLVPFDRQWQLFQPRAADGEPYLVYLSRGPHTIRLTPVIGPVREALWAIDQVTQDMAQVERDVIQLTGPQPDPYRQWRLAERIPDLVPRLIEMAERLEREDARLTEMSGYRPNAANGLGQVAAQLRSIADDPDSLAARLADFARSESVLGNWALTIRDLPLMIDYLLVQSPRAALPVGPAGPLEQLWASAVNFVSSFARDYTSVGTTYRSGEAEAPTLTVWVGRGREWGLIMKDMIEDDFTPRTGVRVNLQVFPPSQLGSGGLNVLLLAATSGTTPDVATGVEPHLPAEFAIRNGVVDLSRLPDYRSVSERFRAGALVPYRYGDGVYALPETQDFMMLFYRSDILDQLGLQPPQTWQDVYDMIWVLQQNGMDFYYPPVGQARGGVAEARVPGFGPFLFQRGGAFYSANGARSALGSPEGLAAFEEWTGLYTNYRIAVSADFLNRMRTGEMPVGVANYWTYVTLSTAAPELTGRWAMAPMPGHRRPDGTIDRSVGGQGAAVMMFPTTQHQREAWEFMKWWTDADTQVRFGGELEGLLGVEARWNSANVEALGRLPWPPRDIAAIDAQWQWFKERPSVPGGYFTDRHLVNAWNRVVLQGWNPRDAMEEAVRAIDRELRNKREEFGLEPAR